jgi:D-alanine-D-alanine ligase-like ATP-grasp enzyme
MLKTIGVECPKGEEFLLPWWADKIRPSQLARGNQSLKTSDMADVYVQEELGYPVYTKPVNGSKGGDIYKVHSANELDEIMDLYDEKKVRVAIVEEPLDMPDYRVVMLDGELISAYKRIPLTVTGDGNSSVRNLLTTLQSHFEAEGRDTRIDAEDNRIVTHLQKQGLTVDSLLSEGQELVLVPVSNLSMGGTSEDVTDRIHSHWSDLAAYIAKNFNLRLCGVDLACSDITDPESPYSVIEVNAAPGLDH